MISVIIPTYNSEKTLVKAINSLYKNNFNDFEVIVVDDGGRDNTSEVIKEYPLQYIRLEKNMGAAFARNKGAMLARGNILLFFDADVEAKEDLLQNINRHFETSDCDVVSGTFAKEPKIPNIFLFFISTLSHYNFSKAGFALSTHLAAIRKEAFDQLKGFDERFKGATVEDFDFYNRLIAEGYKCKLDMQMEAYHNHDFTFLTFFRRMFRFGLLKTPLILKYNKHPNVQKQKKRYLVNGEYVFSFMLILLFFPLLAVTLYIKLNVIIVAWLISYIFVKFDYLSSLNKKHGIILTLSLINDLVVLSGCLLGAYKYYYDKLFKKDCI